MKHKEFNKPAKNINIKYSRRAIPNFRGPYIENNIHKVDTYKLTSDDEFVILASDGLWDFMTSSEVSQIVTTEKKGGKNIIADKLAEEALLKAAKASNLELDDLGKIKPGPLKRSIHDDITIMVVDLKNQVTYKNKF